MLAWDVAWTPCRVLPTPVSSPLAPWARCFFVGPSRALQDGEKQPWLLPTDASGTHSSPKL